MGLDNPLHIIFLILILLLVFGAKRLPEIGRSLGTGMREFKSSVTGETSHTTIPPVATPQQTVPVQQAAPVQAAPVQQAAAVQQVPVAQTPVAVSQQQRTQDESVVESDPAQRPPTAS